MPRTTKPEWHARFYGSAAWRSRRRAQLEAVPHCEHCQNFGRIRRATVANHNPPHRGDEDLFFNGPLESLCKNCHDQVVQAAENRGFRTTPGGDGWPIDPNHPFNRR